MITESARDAIADAFLAECRKTLHEKGRAYAGSEDILAFFKNQAEETGLTKYQVLSAMHVKHQAAVREAIKANPNIPVEKTESLRGRLIDNVNFSILMLCMLHEDAAACACSGGEPPESCESCR